MHSAQGQQEQLPTSLGRDSVGGKKTGTTKNFQNLLKNKKICFVSTNEKSSQGH